MLQKRKIGFLIFFLCSGGLVGAAQAGFLGDNLNILQLQPTVESLLKLQEASVETKLPFGLMKEVLVKSCSEASIDKGKSDLKAIVPLRYRGFLKKRSMFALRYDYQDLLRLFLSLSPQDTDQYCSQKYLLLALLKRTHYYFELLKKHPLGEPFQANIFPAEKLISTIHHDEELTTPELEEFGELVENSIQTVVGDLKAEGIFKQEDLEKLNDKIEVFYTPSCEINKGSFHLLENEENHESHFKHIKLYVSICNPLPNAMQLFSYIEHVLVHELGHYIYFFKDPARKKFTEICRKEEVSTCKLQDFYSLYAETNKEEDYAESFAYWYQYQRKGEAQPESGEHGAASSEGLWRKGQHFSQLFR